MLYQVSLFTSYFNQKGVNRWYYDSSGTPASVLGSFGLAWELGFANPTAGTNLLALLKPCLSVELTFTGYEVMALYDDLDFHSGPLINQAGTGQSEGAAPFIAYGFRTNRVSTAIRRATKRFMGVTEGQMTTGGNIAQSFMTGFLQPVAAEMTAVQVYDDEGQSITYSPCVLQKQKYTTESGKESYRLYPTLLQQLEHSVTSIVWEPYPQVRTQTSRQYGRGI